MWLAVLVVATIVEILITAYTHSVANERTWMAVATSTLVTSANIFIVRSFIEDSSMIGAVILGTALGTFLGIKLVQRLSE